MRHVPFNSVACLSGDVRSVATSCDTGSAPNRYARIVAHLSPLAQLAEQRPVKARVAGSSPARGATEEEGGCVAEAWRVTPLPANWTTLRRRALERDQHRCRAVKRDGARCSQRATDVHHARGRDCHELQDLVSLCSWHHDRITAQEGNAARSSKGRASERYPRSRHPGEL